jgi:hypothetical protein
MTDGFFSTAGICPQPQAKHAKKHVRAPLSRGCAPFGHGGFKKVRKRGSRRKEAHFSRAEEVRASSRRLLRFLESGLPFAVERQLGLAPRWSVN